MKTRSLTGKDVRFLTKTLSKSIGGALERLKDEGSTADKTQIGIRMFVSILGDNVDTIWNWLASVALMTPEELDEAPPATAIHIIRSLEEDEGFKDFFDSVSELFRQGSPEEP